jgi:hypothetical protein
MSSRGNRSTRRKPAPVPICPSQIPHDPGSNPDRRGGKPAINRLSYDTRFWYLLSLLRKFNFDLLSWEVFQLLLISNHSWISSYVDLSVFR